MDDEVLPQILHMWSETDCSFEGEVIPWFDADPVHRTTRVRGGA